MRVAIGNSDFNLKYVLNHFHKMCFLRYLVFVFRVVLVMQKHISCHEFFLVVWLFKNLFSVAIGIIISLSLYFSKKIWSPSFVFGKFFMISNHDLDFV